MNDSLVSLSSSTLSIGQSLTITLSQSYAAADYWRITYSRWNKTRMAPNQPENPGGKAFNTPGSQTIFLSNFQMTFPPSPLQFTFDVP